MPVENIFGKYLIYAMAEIILVRGTLGLPIKKSLLFYASIHYSQ
jgi:hypothetical protein